MINLLPLDLKKNLTYARLNTILLRWTIGIFAGILGIIVVTGGGWLSIKRAEAAYSVEISDTTAQIKVQKLDKVQGQVNAVSNNLKLVVKVLGREVLFSRLLGQIGQTLPKGAVLTGLNITQLEGGLDLQAATVDYQTATQIQVNLQDPSNKIFSKADIVSIQCQADSSANAGNAFSAAYPCKVDVRVQFAANNPFLFINSTTTTVKGTTP